MDLELLGWLRATYGKHHQRTFDSSIGTFRYSRPAALDDETWERLCASEYAPNTFETVTHDEAIERIIDADRSIGWDEVLDGFVLAVSNRWPRGSQTPISAAYARNLEPHRFHNPEAHKNPTYVCDVCGLRREQVLDRTAERYGFHLGSAWNEMPLRHLADLEEWPDLDQPKVTSTELEHFRVMLRRDRRRKADGDAGEALRATRSDALPGQQQIRPLRSAPGPR